MSKIWQLVHYRAVANITLPPTHVLLHLCQLQYCYEVAFKMLKLRVVITVSLLLTDKNVVERMEFYLIFMTQRVFHGLSSLSPNLVSLLCSTFLDSCHRQFYHEHTHLVVSIPLNFHSKILNPLSGFGSWGGFADMAFPII